MEEEHRKAGRPRREAASELRAPLRTRKRKGGQIADKYHIDASEIPAGSSYEWKTVTVYGKSDPSYNVMMREQGWEPVDGSRHPNMVAEDHKGPIIRDGMMLMERPIELTLEAQAEDRDNAMQMVQIKKQQLGETPEGTLPREAPNLRNYNRTTYESLPIDG